MTGSRRDKKQNLKVIFPIFLSHSKKIQRDCAAMCHMFSALLQPQGNKQNPKPFASLTDWLHVAEQEAGSQMPHLASCGTAALSFSQVMTGVGTPSIWHSKRAAPPTFTLWAAGCWWNFDRPADKEVAVFWVFSKHDVVIFQWPNTTKWAVSALKGLDIDGHTRQEVESVDHKPKGTHCNQSQTDGFWGGWVQNVWADGTLSFWDSEYLIEYNININIIKYLSCFCD